MVLQVFYKRDVVVVLYFVYVCFPVARPTFNAEIEVIAWENNEEDDVIPTIIFADILITEQFEVVSIVITEVEE